MVTGSYDFEGFAVIDIFSEEDHLGAFSAVVDAMKPPVFYDSIEVIHYDYNKPGYPYNRKVTERWVRDWSEELDQNVWIKKDIQYAN